MMRGFVSINRLICDRIEDLLPDSFTASLLVMHMRAAARLMNERPNQFVVDAGGGKKSPFTEFREDRLATRIVAFDLSEVELSENEGVDFRVVADLSRSLPLGDETADMIVSRSVIEHLQNVNVFFAESRRALKSGGHIVHVMPCKFSPFSIINQLMPSRLTKALLYYF